MLSFSLTTLTKAAGGEKCLFGFQVTTVHHGGSQGRNLEPEAEAETMESGMLFTGFLSHLCYTAQAQPAQR